MALKLPPDMRCIGGLWAAKSKAGNHYFQGGSSGLLFYIFENRQRAKESDPEWLLYVKSRPPAVPEKPQERLQAVTVRQRPPKRLPKPISPEAFAVGSQARLDDPLDDIFPHGRASK